MTDFLKIAKSIAFHFAHICAYGVETVNSPVSLGIALSLCKVSTHLGRAFIPSVRFENFNFFLAF